MLILKRGMIISACLRLSEYEKGLWAQMLTLARFNARILLTFPALLIGTLSCFHLFKQCVTFITEDYYQTIRKQFSGPFSSSWRPLRCIVLVMF